MYERWSWIVDPELTLLASRHFKGLAQNLGKGLVLDSHGRHRLLKELLMHTNKLQLLMPYFKGFHTSHTS